MPICCGCCCTGGPDMYGSGPAEVVSHGRILLRYCCRMENMVHVCACETRTDKQEAEGPV